MEKTASSEHLTELQVQPVALRCPRSQPPARVSPVLQGWARLLGGAEGGREIPCPRFASQLLPGEAQQVALDSCRAAGTALPWVRSDPILKSPPSISIPSPPRELSPVRAPVPACLPSPERWKRQAAARRGQALRDPVWAAENARAPPAPVPAASRSPPVQHRGQLRGGPRHVEATAAGEASGGSGHTASPVLTMMEKTRATILMGQTGQKQEKMASTR